MSPPWSRVAVALIPAALVLSGCVLVPRSEQLPPDTGPDYPYDPDWFTDDRIQVGTFNADWLWDHTGGEYEPRTEVDFRMVGKLLSTYDFELMALQEVNGDAAMELLELPDSYDWIVGTTGWSQNLAILYKPAVIEIESVRQITLPGTQWPSKDPLVARVRHRDSGLAFTFVSAHLGAFDDTESAEYRQNQILQLKAFLDEELPVDEAGTDFADHVIVAGDLNDTFAGIHGSIDTLEPFEEDPAWTFATEDTLEYTQISHKSKIDHILLSEAIVDRYGERGQEDGCKVVAHDRISPWASYEGGWNGEQVVSDHRPVWIYVDVE
ncbi:MAG: endonuclease/exonuclease/phosphatase family protein [Alphaproteobacteria bacterium]|nr:endonuclease/exonuclease/phosphatase family protein [Alphaproteobacteria bacterium]